jgi:ankyrin repeat protein
MNEEAKRILSSLRDTADFADSDLSDINACAIDGDNALHFFARLGDIATAKKLIEAGIDINKAGDLGYTPLHVACRRGNLEMVKLLVGSGADLFALSEGEPPFTTARLAGQDQICDFLAPLMHQMQSQNQQTWLNARISRLKREIARLEAQKESPEND